MEKLTTIVLTRPNSQKLANCLESLKNFHSDVFVLIDSNEKNTHAEKIAKKFKAKVYKHKMTDDFSSHRNYILKYTKTDWIFYIDDDEVVTDELASVLNNLDKSHAAYAVPRRNIIFSKEFKHSGQWPDYVVRIFQRKMLNGYIGKVHEQPDFKGKLMHLSEPLIHYKHDELAEMVDKTNNWSHIEAELMFTANHPPMNIPRFCTAILREFWHRMIMQKAFLDGKEGIIYAIYQVFSRFVSYSKLWEMQIKNEKPSKDS